MFLTMLGDGTRGPALIRSARERNPYFLPNAMMGSGSTISSGARSSTHTGTRSNTTTRPSTGGSAMRATCLGLLGRTAEAAAEVADVFRGNPTSRGAGAS